MFPTLYLIFLLTVFRVMADRRIVSRPIQTSYNQYGQIDQCTIQFKAYQKLYAHDYLKITFPETIHTALTNLQYSISTANSLQIIVNQKSQSVSSNIYYFKISSVLQQNIWYQIQIQIEKVLTIDYGLIQIEVVSDLTAVNTVRRVWNEGFGYYHVESAAVPDFTILDVNVLSSTLKYNPAQRYPIHISVKSSISVDEPIDLQIGFIDPTIDQTNIVSLLTMANHGNGFLFTGYCNTLCNITGYQCIISQKCHTSSDISIKVTLPYLKANQQYIVEAFIINPVYVSKTRIQAYWKDNNGMTKAIGFSSNYLQVNPITINSQQIRLLWGVPYDTVVNTMNLGLFINDASSQSFSLSSFDIGFSVDNFPPVQGQYQVIIYVGATSILQQSINHNLPSFSLTNEINCKYDPPYINCKNVDSFVRINYRYFVRAKGYFVDTDDLSLFGDVQIKLADIPTQYLFSDLLRGLTIKTILNSDYHDYSKLHSGDPTINIRQTIVSSHPDTLLDNTTSNSVIDFLFSQNSFVGIDPSVKPLQLNFFMNVDLTQMAKINPSTFTQEYQMEIFANPNIMNVSDKGVDIQAYSPTTSEWNVENLPCYVDSSTTPTTQIFRCQKYDDHVHDIQKTNNYISSSYYHKYQWTCGDGDGIDCPGMTDCSSDCHLFRGNFDSDPTSINQGDAGVLSIRNVSFMQDYHSDIKASENDLDFVIAFYHEGDFISASLINGYTINSTRLDKLKVTLINNYNDGFNKLEGSRTPSLLLLDGHFTLGELGNDVISSISVFLPKSLSISSFIEEDNLNKIGCTRQCKGYEKAIETSEDIWTQQSSIKIENLPSLSTRFKIMIPIVYKENLPVSGIIIRLETIYGKVRGIFRVNGSAVMENLKGSPNNLAEPFIPAISWDPTLSYWVEDTNNIFDYNLDIPAIQPYQQYISINIGTTAMTTTSDTSSLTFSIANTNIFSAFSQITVNDKENCLGPFSYKYLNSIQIWNIWCLVYSNSFNEIKIYYPIYPHIFGSNFPFNEVFTYQYSNGDGQMIGYRTQTQSNYPPQKCQTVKQTQYYLNFQASQQNLFTITFPPIQLAPNSFNSMKVKVTFPLTIHLSYVDCSVFQSTTQTQLQCAHQIGSIIDVLITNPSAKQVMIQQIKLEVKTIKTLASTSTSIQSYQIDLYLPMTDSGTFSLTGTQYSPFESHFSSCSNTFTTSTQSLVNQIVMSQPRITSESAEYYGELSFQVDFSDFRINLHQNSYLQLHFEEPILNQYSTCWFDPEQSYWKKQIISANHSTVTFYPTKTLLEFTTIPFKVTCENIITNGASFNASMSWIDGSQVAQTTLNEIIFDHSGINNIYITSSGTLLQKIYNTNSYLGEYHFNLSITTLKDELVQIYVSFPLRNLHQTFLQCEYLKSSSWIPVLCYTKQRSSVEEAYLQFFTISGAEIQIRVYGVHQGDKTTVQNIKILVKKTNMNSYASAFYIYDIPDTISTTITKLPIQISQVSINQQHFITMNYAFPETYSAEFYIEVDELYMMPYIFDTSENFTSSINDTDISCERVRPNILKLISTVTHEAFNKSTIIFGPLQIAYQEQYDQQLIHFNMFVMDGDNVIMESHSHLQNPIYKSDIFSADGNIIWKANHPQVFCQIAYIGYFGPPAYTITKSQQRFVESFEIDINPSLSHSLVFNDLSVELGTNQNVVYIGTLNQSVIGYSYFTFSQNSLSYSMIQSLPIYVSRQKCTLKPQYDEYSIFRRGKTIPIMINLTLCRPMNPMKVLASTNTPYITKNQQLSTQIINFDSQLFYVVLEHPEDTLSTMNNIYELSISLSSDNMVTNEAYNSIETIAIRVIDNSSVIGNPQGKQPQINEITQESISMTLQCNTPAIIYWGIGLYPSMLGINFQEVETRLLQNRNGLQTKIQEIYSWSNLVYGMTYSKDFDGEVILEIDQLEGNKNYIFKYFCMDQNGVSSGGKITEFWTNPSNYSLIKVVIGFEETITYKESNQLACAISQVLSIPYNETISSTFSNCINSSNIYHEKNQKIYDDKITANIRGNSEYYYFYYIDTLRVTKDKIITQLNGFLGTHELFMQGNLTYYSTLRVDTILNNYEPVILNHSLSVSLNEFTLEVDVGLSNSYLIVGYMGKHFDEITMSLPTNYLMKQGYFSKDTRFDEVYSIYGQQKLSATFKNLLKDKQYSVFYFITVDNSVLNGRHSEIKYIDLVTGVQEVFDLWVTNFTTAWLFAAFLIMISL